MPKTYKSNKRSKPFRLAEVDLIRAVDHHKYAQRLAKLQTRLQRIQQAYLHTGDSAVIVFEGWDAAGKGGTIRRMAFVLDPRGFKVWPISAPNEHDAKRHYFTRFWEKLPPKGGICVFDRSWYGRVLVERVEGFATQEQWQRGYTEIRRFEQTLSDEGTRIVKLFLHISKDEQARRFEDRLHDPLKRWKLSYEDFRNRAHWDAYESAIEDMVNRTSTQFAPWHVIAANNKKFARLASLEVIVRRLGKGVDLSPRQPEEALLSIARKQMGIEYDVTD